MKPVLPALALFVLFCVPVALGAERAHAPDSTPTPTATSTPTTSTLTPTPTPTPTPLPLSPAAERGKAVFLANCNRCHPEGKKKVGPSLDDKSLPGFWIKTQVRLGIGGMPSFPRKKISAAQLDDVVQYVKSLRAAKAEAGAGAKAGAKK